MLIVEYIIHIFFHNLFKTETINFHFRVFDKKESKSRGFVCKLSNSLQTFLDS